MPEIAGRGVGETVQLASDQVPQRMAREGVAGQQGGRGEQDQRSDTDSKPVPGDRTVVGQYRPGAGEDNIA